MAKTSQLWERVGINARHSTRDQTLTPAVHGPDSHRHFHLRIRHFCPLFVAHPVRAPSYLCTVRESPKSRAEFRPQKKKKGGPSLNRRRSAEPEDERRTRVHLDALHAAGFAFGARPAPCCSPRQHPHHRHLPLGARLRAWRTGDAGAAEGQPVCAPPRRLLGVEKPAEGRRDAA